LVLFCDTKEELRYITVLTVRLRDVSGIGGQNRPMGTWALLAELQRELGLLDVPYYKGFPMFEVEKLCPV
jgi:hypothetical protein